MTDANAIKKYNHLKNIIAGKYSTERYDAKDVAEEINLDTVSNDLMKSDAERHLAQLIKARPNIVFEPKPEPTPTLEKTPKKAKEKAVE